MDISVHGDLVTIKGQSEEESTREGENWHRREIRRGAFVRSLTLPTEINAEAAQAEFENGVLKLRLPKSEQAKPRRIPIAGASDNN